MKKENRDIDRYAERLRDIENICWGCGKTWTLRECSWHKVKGLLNRQPGCPSCDSRVIIHLSSKGFV